MDYFDSSSGTYGSEASQSANGTGLGGLGGGHRRHRSKKRRLGKHGTQPGDLDANRLNQNSSTAIGTNQHDKSRILDT